MRTNFIIQRILFFILIFLGLNTVVTAQKDAQELQMRGGLPNYFAKALNGDPINVAYLGGSITAQAGWRVYSLAWMKKKFPKAEFKEIHAAIGGTGSDFGVFRLNDHVLVHKPDIVFVEFAVNDGGTDPDKITRSMEGIVRQIWQANPYTDICFVYTLKENFLEDETKGILPRSAQTMEKVADKYNIPTINYGFEVAKQVENGKLIFTNRGSKEVDGVPVFCPDGVHPYVETGHKIYTSVLSRSFDKMLTDGKVKIKKHKLSKPLNPNYFANTKMLDFTVADRSKNWKVVTVAKDDRFKGFSKFLNILGEANETGETLSFKFKGTAVGAYDVMGFDAGKVIVEIDGKEVRTVSRFDKYCTYRRMNYWVVDQLENKEHSVVLKLNAEPIDKESILTKKEDFKEHPEKYKDNNWYIGKIMLDGEILK